VEDSDFDRENEGDRVMHANLHRGAVTLDVHVEDAVQTENLRIRILFSAPLNERDRELLELVLHSWHVMATWRAFGGFVHRFDVPQLNGAEGDVLIIADLGSAGLDALEPLFSALRELKAYLVPVSRVELMSG
jgi:hypothetical protein